ncbi:MAG: adenylyl-sulfate kinase [Verrucomicrobiae bacterium]|nr:adenylyl-sulfate kinase [Verrucomicrobiae bacterium]
MATENLFPERVQMLDRAAKEALLGQRGGVVWLYGLSGSGKSTLAVALERQLHAAGKLVRLLDGDVVRAGLNAGLGFSDDDRRENIRRVAEVARLFAATGVLTLCAFITPQRAMRDLAREILGEADFLEVYVRASYEACAQRDVKGLYAKARQGGVAAFTGRDSTFEEPPPGVLTLDTEAQSEQQSLLSLYEAVRARFLL